SGCAVVGVLMIVVCGGLLYFGYRQVSGEGEVAVEVDRFFDEIAQGRAADYYRQHGSDEFKNVTSEAEFVGMCQSLQERLGGLRSKKLSGFKVRNQNLSTYVDAAYDCQFERGKGAVRTSFKRQKNQWVLLGFNVNSPELLKDLAQETCPHCGQRYQAG